MYKEVRGHYVWFKDHLIVALSHPTDHALLLTWILSIGQYTFGKTVPEE